MTDLRDQLADFEAAARRLTAQPETIPLTRGSDLGPLLRDLRQRAGLSQRDLARRAHVSKSGLSAREKRSGMTAGALVDHAQALGYALALIPLTPDRRTAA